VYQQKEKAVYDAVILSDLHLGSSNCQARGLRRLLEDVQEQRVVTGKLILNGDVFDSFDFRRLNKNHWKVLSLLRKLSDKIEIIWISGNHDGSAEVVSHLLGVTVVDEYVLSSGGRKILILHGHQFDDFIDAHPFLTWVGDLIYFFLQKIDRTHYFAKLAKKGSKTFLRCAKKIEEGSREHAIRKSCQAVCCGHTHHATFDQSHTVHYFNSGCWTELPCTFLTITDGSIEMHQMEAISEPAEEPAAGELAAAAMV
jgi:UDP-2,3-diacylglucosamine pyrophosphatase LpxH